MQGTVFFFVALVMAMLMMIVYMSAIVKFEAGEGVTGGARELVTLSELRLKQSERRHFLPPKSAPRCTLHNHHLILPSLLFLEHQLHTFAPFLFWSRF